MGEGAKVDKRIDDAHRTCAFSKRRCVYQMFHGINSGQIVKGLRLGLVISECGETTSGRGA